MNKIDLDYQSLLQDILDNGVVKKDRTGTGTLSVFGRQIRHKMSDGFPLLTTKKMAWKTMITELLWFLKGDTNIKYLVDNNCHIWDGDAYKKYIKSLLELEKNGNHTEMNKWMRDNGDNTLSLYTKEGFIEKIKNDDIFCKKWGELGPIYGKQWRKWDRYEFVDDETYTFPIDQIKELIHLLKTDPDSRRMIVNAWNVGELDGMTLPPCHYGFQVYTREFTIDERMQIWLSKQDGRGEFTMECLENIPTRSISLSWNQRSCDFPLGIPINISSYSLLLMMIAKKVNMIPDELIGNFGDCHIYLNQIDGVKEQIGIDLTIGERIDLGWENYVDGNEMDFDILLSNAPTEEESHEVCDDYGIPRRTREPFKLPTVKISDKIVDDISEYTLDDILLENYISHPKINYPLSN